MTSSLSSDPDIHLVLASASPRRRELLRFLGIPFEVVVPAISELSDGAPLDLVAENARRKAVAGLALASPGALLLGVDTDVVIDGRALGKPENASAARARLERLSGRTHEVLSAVALARGQDDVRTEVARTAVSFRRLGPEEVDSYVASGEWRDRAGGYAVQGLGSALVERVEGDLSNVIGLPIPTLSRMIASLQDH